MLHWLSSLFILQAETNDELPFDEGTLTMIMIGSTILFLVLAVGIGYWVYKDASNRPNNETLWALAIGGMTFLFFPIAIVLFIVYFFVRDEESVPDEAETHDTGAEW